MHLESLEKHMGLMAHTLTQTLEFRTIKVIRENGVVIRVRALLDNDTSTLPRRQTTNISQTLLSNNNVEVMLCLIDVGSERNDTTNTSGIGLGRTNTGRVHDAVLGVPEEVCRAT